MRHPPVGGTRDLGHEIEYLTRVLSMPRRRGSDDRYGDVSSLSRCGYPEVFLSGKRSQVPVARALVLATPLDEVYGPWVAGIIGAGRS